MNKIIIPFMESGSRIPLVEFTLGEGRNYIAMLDTGSESTLFDKDIQEGVNYKKEETDYKMSLVGLSGDTPEFNVSIIDAVFTVMSEERECSFEVHGITSDLSGVSKSINERYGKHIIISAILGSDFLKKYGAKIDYRRKQLSIKK